MTGLYMIFAHWDWDCSLFFNGWLGY